MPQHPHVEAQEDKRSDQEGMVGLYLGRTHQMPLEEEDAVASRAGHKEEDLL
jgi:hypothetical protein